MRPEVGEVEKLPLPGSKVAAMGPVVRTDGFQDGWGQGSHSRHVLAGGGRIQMTLRGRSNGSCPLGDVRLVAQSSMVAPYLVM